jgi:hypothetical protein
MNRLIVLTIAMCGCASGYDISDRVEVIEPIEETVSEIVSEPSMPECHITIDAKQSQQETILREAEHWSRAAGCTVSFAADGIPFTVSEGLLADSREPGKYVYGVTNVTTDREGRFVRCNSIEVSNSSSNPLRTLRHELGHCFGILSHTEDGLMKDFHYSWEPYPINEAALNLLCNQVSCSAYQAESVH